MKQRSLVPSGFTLRRLPSRSQWKPFAACWLVLSLITGVWSLATPISGGPDEPAHIIKAAAVVRGQVVGQAIEGGTQVNVPAYISHTNSQACFAYAITVTADCMGAMRSDGDRTVTSVTTAGLYNPLYYALVGWPSLIFATVSGVYAMRFVSGVLCSLFLALAFMVIFTWHRRTLPLLGFAVALTPMVFFLDAVINPNALEIAATLAAFVGMLGIVKYPSESQLFLRSMIVLVSASVAANMRGISPLWVAIALLVPLILSTASQIHQLIRRRAVRITVFGIALSTVTALLWTLLSNSLGTAQPSSTPAVPGSIVGASPLRGFAQIFAGTFDYGQGYVGVFGWLDTPAPPAVFFVWSFFIGCLVVAACVALRGRLLIFAISLISCLTLLPPTLQAIYVVRGGIIWQGRYALPVFVCLMVGLAAALSDHLPRLETTTTRRFICAIAGLWFASELYAFINTLRRYSVGLGGNGASWKRMFLDPNWNPPGGTLLIAAAFAATCGVAALFISRRPCPAMVRSHPRAPSGQV